MGKLKYQTKFLLYHIGIISLLLIGTVGYFYRVLVGEMKNKEYQDFSIIAEKTATQLDGLFYDMDRTALQIAANPDIVGIFQQLTEMSGENYFTGHPVIKAEMKKLLESYNFKNNGHSRICLYNKGNDFVCTSNRAVTEEGVIEFFEGNAFSDVRDFFQQTEEFVYYRNPETDVLASGESQQSDYLAIVREIKDYYSNSTRCGYVEVQESTEKLDEILAGFDADMRIELFDNHHELVYNSGKKAGEDDKNYYKTKIQLQNAPYEVQFYKKPAKYSEAMKQFYPVLAAVVIIIMIVAVSLEKILIKHLSKPLINLDHSLKSVTMDNLHVDIVDEDSADVVHRLEDSFNAMLEKLNNSMQMQITAKTNEVKSHFFALQSQMNPHFLHNILAIISMESQLDGNTKIPDICHKLGNILRYNSQMGDGYSTVEEECAIAEDYMLLMKVRYEELFEYKIQIEKGTEQLCIPKLIIQPLCENCFQHGLKNVEPIWKIRIHTWKEQKRWFIKIQDNGSGFSEEFLKNFEKEKENLNKGDVKSVLENISIGGLCIPNIYTRMKIEYGNSFVCELYNEEKGAVVLLGGEIYD